MSSLLQVLGVLRVRAVARTDRPRRSDDHDSTGLVVGKPIGRLLAVTMAHARALDRVLKPQMSLCGTDGYHAADCAPRRPVVRWLNP